MGSFECLVKGAVQQLHVPVRAYHRVLKLARTIAGLAVDEMVAANHMPEAAHRLKFQAKFFLGGRCGR